MISNSRISTIDSNYQYLSRSQRQMSDNRTPQCLSRALQNYKSLGKNLRMLKKRIKNRSCFFSNSFNNDQQCKLQKKLSFKKAPKSQQKRSQPQVNKIIKSNSKKSRSRQEVRFEQLLDKKLQLFQERRSKELERLDERRSKELERLEERLEQRRSKELERLEQKIQSKIFYRIKTQPDQDYIQMLIEKIDSHQKKQKRDQTQSQAVQQSYRQQ